MSQLKLFAGNANPALARAVARELGIPLGKAYVGRFPDGEIEIKILENVRGTDCFILQPTSEPANDNLMELLLIMDALRRASATRITPVIPYFGYGRQDRKAQPRVPISSKLVSNLIVTAGADRVLTMDLHAGQIQGFFDIPVDHLYSSPVIIDYFKKKRLKDVVVVSPDAGGVERARAFAKRLNYDLAIIDKRRTSPTDADVLHVVGDVRGKIALIVDDLVDTAGTLAKAAKALRATGATKVYAACSHGVLAGPAIERLESAPLEELVITDTIALNGKKLSKIKVLSVASILGEAIKRIHEERTVSALFV
ncbi:MAG: Ribose-phosphate pyrophosphokinase [Elusimicrobia bacterium]|nr:Ribose-phosphate pyrophosphokinase [Elusimicrobiota bacterium]